MIAVLAAASTIAALALFAGGWEWFLISVAAFVLSWLHLRSVKPVLGMSVQSLCWLAAFAAIGDRRLFFPFTIQFATQLACLEFDHSWLRAVMAAVWIVGIFSAVRLIQAASLIVLLVELAVAALAIAVALTAYRQAWRNRALAAAIASLLAFAGLFAA